VVLPLLSGEGSEKTGKGTPEKKAGHQPCFFSGNECLASVIVFFDFDNDFENPLIGFVDDPVCL
jgi:hypothetical protein